MVNRSFLFLIFYYSLFVFLRFKVRAEISRKSKDAEGKLSVQRNNMSVMNSSSPQALESEGQDPSGTYAYVTFKIFIMLQSYFSN